MHTETDEKIARERRKEQARREQARESVREKKMKR
jgi:hypothetical protein